MPRGATYRDGMDRGPTPFDVIDGPNAVANACNAAAIAIRAASQGDIIAAARNIAAVSVAASAVMTPLYSTVSAVSPNGRPLSPRAGGFYPGGGGVEAEPDADFKNWCLAADAYFAIIGQAHRRFIDENYRNNFAGAYQDGKSAIEAAREFGKSCRENRSRYWHIK